ncbi:MAG: DNA-directed RNA polymerase subunit N [Candidatus Aenigmatarchaeota archaeon]
MIIPIRCFTCGKPIGHLWEKYKAEIEGGKDPKEVLDRLGLDRYCCRAVFLGHIELVRRTARFKRV